ncbi:MAG: hypothetical protein ACKODG_01050, partial [Betaproteobacteria bacterium]
VLNATGSGRLAVDQLVVAGSLALTSAADASMGAATVGGDLQVRLAGELAQTGAVRVTGRSVFDAGAGIIAITQTSGALAGGASFAGSTMQIAGAVALSAGPAAALQGDAVRVQSPLRGSSANNDSLTLSAEGGSIVFEQQVGGQAGAGLEALTVTNAVNLRFDQPVRIEGDLVLNATGTVVFSKALELAAGGRLVVTGADSVEFAQGLALQGAARSDAVTIRAGANDQVQVIFRDGMLAGDANRVAFTGVETLNLGTVAVDGGALEIASLAIAGRTGADLVTTPAQAGGAVTLSSRTLSIVKTDDVTLAVSLNVGGLSIDSAAGQLTQAEGTQIQVSGDAVIRSTSTVLTAAGNDFGSRLTLRGGAATILDRNALTVSLDAAGPVTLTAAAGSASVDGRLTGARADLTLQTGAAASLGALQIGGFIAVTASGSISQTGDLSIGGESRLDAGPQGQIALDRSDNDFGATVTLIGRAASLSDRNALAVTFDLSQRDALRPAGEPASAVVRAGGSLAVSGTVTGAQARLSAISQGEALSAATLRVDGNTSLASESGLIRLGEVQIAGDLLLQGGVEQTGAAKVTGTTEVRAAGRVVDLSRGDNQFDGPVRIEAGVARIHDAGPLDLSLAVSGDASVRAQGALRLAAQASGANSLLSVRTDADGEVLLVSGRLAGRVDIDSAGAVRQQGALEIAGGGRISAAAQSIVLDDAANRIGGTLSLIGAAVTVAATGDVSLDLDSAATTQVRTTGLARIRAAGDLAAAVAAAGVSALSERGDVFIDAQGPLKVVDGISAPMGKVRITSSGSIVMEPDSSISTTEGDIALQADGDIGIARIQSSSGSIRVTSSGALYDSTTDRAFNVRTSRALQLAAVNGIGQFGEASLRVSVGSVEARNSSSGHIVLAGETGLRVGATGVVNESRTGWVALLTQTGRIEP